MEVLVGMFIFTLMVGSMTGAFTTLLQRKSDVKKRQQQTEEFSLAMSYVGKKMRMSDLGASCGGTSCTILDHNTGNTPVTYAFTGGELRETIGGSTAVIASDVTGRFTAANTAASEVPFITMQMMASSGDVATSVQTTVSLRSY